MVKQLDHCYWQYEQSRAQSNGNTHFFCWILPAFNTTTEAHIWKDWNYMHNAQDMHIVLYFCSLYKTPTMYLVNCGKENSQEEITLQENKIFQRPNIHILNTLPVWQMVWKY